MAACKGISCILLLNPNVLATGSPDSTIKIWDIKENTLKHSLRGHTS